MEEIEVIKENITRNIAVPNLDLETLKKYFPHYFNKDGKFDFEKFKKHLSENEVSFSTESYGLEWLGKSYARLLATDPATTLLKADKIHNVKPENANSENLLIKGDNLEVLKHLANAYYEKIKMIYIDPPYNTGSDGFVYQDDRKFDAKELAQMAGISEEKAKRILDFTRSKSNSHSAWLTFMYPRLYIAKQLLKDDGVIFISIDDNEVAQLRLLMDEIFGEENFISDLIWNLRSGSQAGHFTRSHEYILCYAKYKERVRYFEELKGGSIDHSALKKISNSNPLSEIEFPAGMDFEGDNAIFEGELGDSEKQILIDKLVFENGKLKYPARIQAGWAMRNQILSWIEGKETFDTKGQRVKRFYFNKQGILRYEKERNTVHPKTILPEIVGSTKNGSDELEKILGYEVLNFPKPSSLIKFLVSLVSKKEDVILDFFAGSGTTGDAVMQLNAEDGGNRKYILVQLPEPIDEKKNKTAYDFVKNDLKAEPTIFEITKERLIRAARKIKAETIDKKIAEKKKEIEELEGKLDLEDKQEKIKQLKAEIKALEQQDLGFKIFETMPIWDNYNYEAEEYDSSHTLFDTGKLTEDDIKALLTTWKTYDGIPLTQDLEPVDLGNYTAYYGKGKLYLMHKEFKTEHLKAILEKIDTDKRFEPRTIIAFGYHFESARLRELAENVRAYNNKKKTEIKFIARY